MTADFFRATLTCSPIDREEMTDHGKEESEGEREGEEASGSQSKARSRQEERREEKRREEESPSCEEEGEQSEGSQEGQEGSAAESSGEVREGCTAAQSCNAAQDRVGSEESDGTAEARGSGRTAPYAGTGSHAEQRLRTRAAALAQHGSFRLNGDRRGSVARINREGMRAALPSRWHDACIVPAQSLTLRAATRVRRHGLT